MRSDENTNTSPVVGATPASISSSPATPSPQPRAAAPSTPPTPEIPTSPAPSAPETPETSIPPTNITSAPKVASDSIPIPPISPSFEAPSSGSGDIVLVKEKKPANKKLIAIIVASILFLGGIVAAVFLLNPSSSPIPTVAAGSNKEAIDLVLENEEAILSLDDLFSAAKDNKITTENVFDESFPEPFKTYIGSYNTLCETICNETFREGVAGSAELNTIKDIVSKRVDFYKDVLSNYEKFYAAYSQNDASALADLTNSKDEKISEITIDLNRAISNADTALDNYTRAGCMSENTYETQMCQDLEKIYVNARLEYQNNTIASRIFLLSDKYTDDLLSQESFTNMSNAIGALRNAKEQEE